jgi:hypothetical protein
MNCFSKQCVSLCFLAIACATARGIPITTAAPYINNPSQLRWNPQHLGANEDLDQTLTVEGAWTATVRITEDSDGDDNLINIFFSITHINPPAGSGAGTPFSQTMSTDIEAGDTAPFTVNGEHKLPEVNHTQMHIHNGLAHFDTFKINFYATVSTGFIFDSFTGYRWEISADHTGDETSIPVPEASSPWVYVIWVYAVLISLKRKLGCIGRS